MGCADRSFDIEGNEEVHNKSAAAALTTMLVALRAEGEKTNPHFQISFCTPVYPTQPQVRSSWLWIS